MKTYNRKIARPAAMFFLLALAGILFAGAAQATFITPKRVMIEDKQRTATLTIHNTSDDTIAYRFGWEHRTFSPTGESLLLKDGETSPGYRPADPFLQFSPRQIILKPKESQKIRVLVRRPADMTPGEYHSHLLIKMEKISQKKMKPQPGMSGLLQVQTNASIPVFLRQGATTVDIKIQNAQAISRDGREYIRYSLANNSTRSIYASPYIDCSTASGTDTIQLSTARIYAEAKTINFDTLVPLGTSMSKCSAAKLRLVGIADFEYKNEKVLTSADIRK